ncbi:hypothetical protein HK405_000816 [Cladochytrium tenue]|nr:hypothetical protein HK405_000816 [Cladochytrium tenue]
MADAVTLVVSLVILYFIVRYLLGGGGTNADSRTATSRAAAAGRLAGSPSVGAGARLPTRPRRLHAVSPSQVDAVCSMFPHFPRHMIEADLAVTGSVEATCDKILTGLLLPPPAPAPSSSSTSTSSSAPGAGKPSWTPVVVSTLGSRAADDAGPPAAEPPKNVWEASPEKREAHLRARKEHMVLAARERLRKAKELEAAATKGKEAAGATTRE